MRDECSMGKAVSGVIELDSMGNVVCEGTTDDGCDAVGVGRGE